MGGLARHGQGARPRPARARHPACEHRRPRRRRCRAQCRDRARGLAGERGPVRDIVVLNAAAGLVAFELAKDPSQFQRAVLDRFRDKMAVAEEAIDSGAAAQARTVDLRHEGLTRSAPVTSVRGMRTAPRMPRGRSRSLRSPVRHVLVDPVEGLRDGLLPEPQLTLALVGVHLGLPARVLLPVRAQLVEVRPEADREAGRIGRPERAVSATTGRTTGTPRMSAWNCIRVLLAIMPPSTFSSVRSTPESALTASSTSRVWNAVASRAARAMWPCSRTG